MKIEIYKCDRCGKEDKKPEEIDLLNLTFGKSMYQTFGGKSIYGILPELRVDWCADCRKKLNLLIPYGPADRLPDQKPPTMEELLREIIREEIGILREDS